MGGDLKKLSVTKFLDESATRLLNILQLSISKFYQSYMTEPVASLPDLEILESSKKILRKVSLHNLSNDKSMYV